METNNRHVIGRKAVFSEDRRFRFSLTIIWEPLKPLLHFVMLNPSTADEVSNDPTVERCERRARMWSYGGLIVTNIFALRATNPDDLYCNNQIIGKDNNLYIQTAAENADITICAWGGHGKLLDRGRDVKTMLDKTLIPLWYLKMGRNGQPYHPLYLPYTSQPKRWT